MLKLAKKTIVVAMACLLAFCVILPGVAQASEYNDQSLAIETILGAAQSGINSQSLAQAPVACLGYTGPNCTGSTIPEDGHQTTYPVCTIPEVVSVYCQFQECQPCRGK